jgi:3-oxoacyl-[acyl-carrier-protein] synthase-1
MVQGQQVYVAGVGVISAIGHTTGETLRALQQGISGIGPLSLFPSLYQDVLPVGEVSLSNEALAARLNRRSRSHTHTVFPRTALLGMAAARQAVDHAGIDLAAWRCGLISATTVGGMDRTESFFPAFLENPTAGHLRDVVHHACGNVTELMAEDLQISNFISTINTACSSSVNAIMYGARLLAQGMLDVVVAGGADALTKFTLNGFNSLKILDTAPCRPFDASRNGLNLGEGAGYVVLVGERVCRQLQRPMLATVAGFGNTNDAYHQTASSPEGRGSYAAMTEALSMAGLSVDAIDYINLHGTGTINNDLSESTAIQRLFGEHVPAVSSTKAFTGHTLGASGGIEAVFSVLALTEQCIFPNLRFEQAMPETGITPQRMFAPAAVRHVMSNSFGFGGNCSSIIFSTSPDRV